MRRIILTLFGGLILMNYATATIYTYANSGGVYSYNMPNTTAAVANTAPGVTTLGGNIAGALAASAAARTTGNPAAAMGAQTTLVNAGASIVSAGVMDALSPLLQH